MPCCEVCGKDNFALIATQMREGVGRISRCNSCGLVIQDTSWTDEETRRYYNQEYQKTNSLDLREEQSPRQHFESRLKTIQPIMERIRRFLRRGMRVLDVGCGAGELLYVIKPYVGEVVGVELCEGFVNFMKQELGIEAYAQDVNKVDFGARKFDFIISIATLDHLPKPLATLKTMKTLLSKDGIMYLEVPNLNEALNVYLPEQTRKAYNKFFWHKAHFFYFTSETLSKLTEKAGLSCEISCRHEYTLGNYLNWYFKGTPQATFTDATSRVGLFAGVSEFEKGMNKIFSDMEKRFHQIINRSFAGDTLCCVAKPLRK